MNNVNDAIISLNKTVLLHCLEQCCNTRLTFHNKECINIQQSNEINWNKCLFFVCFSVLLLIGRAESVQFDTSQGKRSTWLCSSRKRPSRIHQTSHSTAKDIQIHVNVHVNVQVHVQCHSIGNFHSIIVTMLSDINLYSII